MATSIQDAMVVSMPSHTSSMQVRTEPIPVTHVSTPNHRPGMSLAKNDVENLSLRTIPWVGPKSERNLVQCMPTLVAIKHLPLMMISTTLPTVSSMIIGAARPSNTQLQTNQRTNSIARQQKPMVLHMSTANVSQFQIKILQKFLQVFLNFIFLIF